MVFIVYELHKISPHNTIFITSMIDILMNCPLTFFFIYFFSHSLLVTGNTYVDYRLLKIWTSLVVQGLRLHASNAGAWVQSLARQVLHAAWCGPPPPKKATAVGDNMDGP